LTKATVSHRTSDKPNFRFSAFGLGGETDAPNVLGAPGSCWDTLFSFTTPLESRFKGDEYNALVGWLRTPAEKASGLPENNRKWFVGWVDLAFVSTNSCEKHTAGADTVTAAKKRALEGTGSDYLFANSTVQFGVQFILYSLYDIMMITSI
jgi:hypothetical protein